MLCSGAEKTVPRISPDFFIFSSTLGMLITAFISSYTRICEKKHYQQLTLTLCWIFLGEQHPTCKGVEKTVPSHFT